MATGEESVAIHRARYEATVRSAFRRLQCRRNSYAECSAARAACLSLRAKSGNIRYALAKAPSGVRRGSDARSSVARSSTRPTHRHACRFRPPEALD